MSVLTTNIPATFMSVKILSHLVVASDSPQVYSFLRVQVRVWFLTDPSHASFTFHAPPTELRGATWTRLQ